jgi:CheY-like chemotaxis protein
MQDADDPVRDSFAAVAKPPAQRSLLILHINDSTDDQVLLQAAAMRARVPIEWHVAESVDRGISYLQSMINLSRSHAVRWLDLVVLDLVLHNGSGLEVLKFIRSTPEISTLPVVVLTGNMNPATLEEAYTLGVNALHEKPASFEDSVELAAGLYKNWSTARRPRP